MTRPGDRASIGPIPVSAEAMVDFESVVWDRGANAHNDPDAARRDGLTRPIASGQHQMAFLHRLLGAHFGDAWNRGGSIDVRYVHPVHAGDELTATLEVVEVRDGPGGAEVRSAVQCANQDGVPTSRGTATVRMPAVDRPGRTGPLAGLRVIELTHAWAGPYCGMMLADMGADVLKIESPSQPPEARGGYPYVDGESVPFLMLHRGKRSVTLDLKADDDRARLLELVADADVLVQNFRPGAVRRLGLDHETLHRLNPRLVYGTISGYGAEGEKAHLPGVNMIAQAESGLAATTMRDGAPPVPLGTALCDIVAAMWLSHGITCALLERERSGLGQHVESSLVDAGLSLMHSPAAMHLFGHEVDSAQRYDGNAPSAFLPAADGTYVALFASYPALWDRFVRSPHFAHLADDPRYVTRESRNLHAEALHGEVGTILRTASGQSWVDELGRVEVPVSLVRTVGEVLAESETRRRGMVTTVHHPGAGTVPVIGVPVRLARTPGAAGTRSPRLGEHRAEVLDRGWGGDRV